MSVKQISVFIENKTGFCSEGDFANDVMSVLVGYGCPGSCDVVCRPACVG